MSFGSDQFINFISSMNYNIHPKKICVIGGMVGIVNISHVIKLVNIEKSILFLKKDHKKNNLVHHLWHLYHLCLFFNMHQLFVVVCHLAGNTFSI